MNMDALKNFLFVFLIMTTPYIAFAAEPATAQSAPTATITIPANANPDAVAKQMAIDFKIPLNQQPQFIQDQRGQIKKYIDLAKGEPVQIKIKSLKGGGILLFAIGGAFDAYNAYTIDLPRYGILNPDKIDTTIAVGGRFVNGLLLDAPTLFGVLRTGIYYRNLSNDDTLKNIETHMLIDEKRKQETTANIKSLINSACIVIVQNPDGSETAKLGPRALGQYPNRGCNITVNGKMTHTENIKDDILTFFNDQKDRLKTASLLLAKQQNAYNKRATYLLKKPEKEGDIVEPQYISGGIRTIADSYRPKGAPDETVGTMTITADLLRWKNADKEYKAAKAMKAAQARIDEINTRLKAIDVEVQAEEARGR